MAFLWDPTQGFQFEWTPILEGFKATTAQLPEMIAPELTSLQDQIDAKIAEIGAREAERAIQLAKPKVDAAIAAAAAKAPGAAPGAAPGKEFKSESLSGSEFARRLQSAIFDAKDRTPQQQLGQLQRIAKSSEKTAQAVAKLQVGMI
jgi:hypothetical protein